jgi:hypothetical protein
MSVGLSRRADADHADHGGDAAGGLIPADTTQLCDDLASEQNEHVGRGGFGLDYAEASELLGEDSDHFLVRPTAWPPVTASPR